MMQANPQNAVLAFADSCTTSPETLTATPNSLSTNASQDARYQVSSEATQNQRRTPNDPRSVATAMDCSDPSRTKELLTPESLSNLHSGLITPKEADESLNIFRSQMLQWYPIMVIPENTNAQRLKAQNPFLWLTIMAVTSKSSLRQRYLGLEIRKMMANRIILEGERSLDLFKGLLVYTAWSQYYIFSKPIITNVIQLAIAILADLGLNKPVLKEPFVILSEFDSRGCPGRPITTTRSLEERRAAVACYSVSQLVTTYFARTEPLRWTAYLEECLWILSASEEAPGDKVLVHMVRLQVILSRSFEAPWHDDFSSVKDDLAKAPMICYTSALNAQLNEYRSKLPDDLRENGMALYLNVHQQTA